MMRLWAVPALILLLSKSAYAADEWQACIEFSRALLRLEERVFLDPSAENRRRQTQRFIEDVVLPLKKTGGGALSACSQSSVSRAAEVLDLRLLRNVVPVDEPNEMHKRDMRYWTESADAVRRELNRPQYESLEERQYAITAVKLAEEFPGRFARLQAALAFPPRYDCSTHGDEARREEAQAALWSSALRVIQADPDPRRWDPRELAAVAIEGRRAVQEWKRQRSLPDGEEKAKYDLSASHGVPIEGRVFACQRALARAFGVKEAHDILGLTSPLMPEESRRDPRSFSDAGFSHFPGERALHEYEWQKAHPGKFPTHQLEKAEGDVFARDRADFLEMRWFETEKLAPRADLEKVKREIELLESETPK